MSVPHEMTIPRRLAGRYLKIELLGISSSFDFVFDKLTFKAQTSVTNEAPGFSLYHRSSGPGHIRSGLEHPKGMHADRL